MKLVAKYYIPSPLDASDWFVDRLQHALPTMEMDLVRAGLKRGSRRRDQLVEETEDERHMCERRVP